MRWSQCFPLKISTLLSCKDIKKVLYRRFIKGYKEHTTSKWYSNYILESRQERFWDNYIIKMYWSYNHAISMHQSLHQNDEDLYSKDWATKWFRLHLKNNIMSSICCLTYRGHIRRPRSIASHFPYVVMHTKGTSGNEC